MLVLTRKRGEAITIGENVQVHILSIQGNRVRVGIEAPPDVSIRRGEMVFEFQLPETNLDGTPVTSDSEQHAELVCA